MGVTDAELVVRIGAGDVDALGQLYERHVDRVVAHAATRCRDADEVADLVSTVWLSVWRSAPTFDPRRGEVVPWIVGIASHRFVDLRRGERRVDALTEKLRGSRFLDGDDVERIAEKVAAARAAGPSAEAVADLPPAQREAFELVAIDGLTAEQAAEVVGSTPTAVRMRLSRARQTLRRRLATTPSIGRPTHEELA